MAHLVFTDAFFSYDGNDLSSDVRQLTLDYKSELQDDSTMGVGSTRKRIGGLLDWTVDVEFAQDFDAAALDSILFPLVGFVKAVIVRPTSAVVGANNPEYTGQGILETYPPITGSVGEIAASACTIQAAGALARAVA